MASPNIYPGGFNLSGTVFDGGPPVAQLAPSYASGSVQWLDTIGGSNANAGTMPELPVATIAQAVTNSAANGIIVIGAGSAQNISVSQTLGLAGLHIIGCGSGTSRPRFTCSGAIASMFDLTVANVILENLYFPASTAIPTSRVLVEAASCEIRGCYFECGTSDTGQALAIDVTAANTLVRDCTFVSTASRPAIGCKLSQAVADVQFESCIFDGGSFGWSDYALKVTAGATRIKLRDCSFIRRSDLGITVTGTTYKLFGVSMDGTSNILLTA